MVVDINKKSYTLHFGFKFIEQANAERGMTVDAGGNQINTRTNGVQMLLTGLDTYDPTAVRDIIRYGLNTEKSQPSLEDVEQFVEELATKGDSYFDYVDEVAEEVKKQPLLNIRRGNNKPTK